MKSFLSWIIVFILAFGGLSVFTHISLLANPTRIVIAFDDSFYMKDVWPRIAVELETLVNRRYTEYFVISNKEKISREWETEGVIDRFLQTRLFIGEYAVADLVNSQKYPELKQADRILVFTSGQNTSGLAADKRATIFNL